MNKDAASAAIQRRFGRSQPTLQANAPSELLTTRKVARHLTHKSMVGRVAKTLEVILSHHPGAYVVAAEAAIAAWQAALADHLAD